jgi:hypothetical protein
MMHAASRYWNDVDWLVIVVWLGVVITGSLFWIGLALTALAVAK